VLAVIPVSVLAHAQLLQTDPAAGSVVAAAPSQVTLVFSEPVTPAGFGVHVYSPSGEQVAGTLVQRGAVLIAPLPGAAQHGTYVVLWQVFAADTHPSRGAFAFSVVAASANPYAGLLDQASAGTSTPLGVALQALARWVHFIGFALVFGLVAYGALTHSRQPARLINAGIVLLIAAELLALVAQLASLSFDGDTVLAVLGSPFGRILGLRLGAALLAWTLIATERDWPVLVLGGVIALLDGFTAHAIPNVPLVGQVLVAVHVGAMGLWVGGLVGFIRRPDARFVRYAIATFGTAVATGLVLALVHTKWLTDLLTTDYGHALLIKMGVVAIAALTAFLARRRSELAIAVAAIGAASLVAALPPPL
jgi:copper transport protein